jgi:hypothetical protein
MPHDILYRTLPGTCTLKQVADFVDEYVKGHGDRYGTDVVRCPNHMALLPNYEKAYDYICSVDRGDYDGIAVQYADFSHIKDSAKVEDLRKKMAELQQKKMEFINAHSPQAQKAAYIGCPECGSKLSRERLKGNKCPLCYTDLRASSTLERIESFNRRIAEYQKKIQAEREKDQKKAKIMWLVKFEYHS